MSQPFAPLLFSRRRDGVSRHFRLAMDAGRNQTDAFTAARLNLTNESVRSFTVRNSLAPEFARDESRQAARQRRRRNERRIQPGNLAAASGRLSESANSFRNTPTTSLTNTLNDDNENDPSTMSLKTPGGDAKQNPNAAEIPPAA